MQRSTKGWVVIFCGLFILLCGNISVNLTHVQARYNNAVLESPTILLPGFTLTPSLQPTTTPIPPTDTNTATPTLTGTPTPIYTYIASPTKPYSVGAISGNLTIIFWLCLGSVVIIPFATWGVQLASKNKKFKKIKEQTEFNFDPEIPQTIRDKLSDLLNSSNYIEAIRFSRNYTDSGTLNYAITLFEEHFKNRIKRPDQKEQLYESLITIIPFLIKKEYSSAEDQIDSFEYVYELGGKEFRDLLFETIENYPQRLRDALIRKREHHYPIVCVNSTILKLWDREFPKRTDTKEFRRPYFPIYCEDDFKEKLFVEPDEISNIRKKLFDFIVGKSNDERKFFEVSFNDEGGQTRFATWFYSKLLSEPIEKNHFFPIYIKIDSDLSVDDTKKEIKNWLVDYLLVYFYFNHDTFMHHGDQNGLIKFFKEQNVQPGDPFEKISVLAMDFENYVDADSLNQLIKRIVELADLSKDIGTPLEFSRISRIIPRYRNKLVVLIDFGKKTSYGFIQKTLEFFNEIEEIKVVSFISKDKNPSSLQINLSSYDISRIINKRFEVNDFDSVISDGVIVDKKDFHNEELKRKLAYIKSDWLFRSSNGSPAKALKKAHELINGFKNLSKEDIIWKYHIPEIICGKTCNSFVVNEVNMPFIYDGHVIDENIKILEKVECTYLEGIKEEEIKLFFYVLKPTWDHTLISTIINAVIKTPLDKYKINEPIFKVKEDPDVSRCIYLDYPEIGDFKFTIATIYEWKSGPKLNPIDDIKKYYNIRDESY